MTKSADEAEIRNAVVERLRELMPSARIVHELNVAGTGTNRIDVAAITSTAIVAVEIKSKKDTLKRLEDQWNAFSECCHFVVVAAHEKHFSEYRSKGWCNAVPSELRINHPKFAALYSLRNRFWRYPKPENPTSNHGGFGYPDAERWYFQPLTETQHQPRAASMLGMLWAEELREECSKHRLSCSSRSTRPDMIRDMVWHLTGKEICHAVCRQLRARNFAEADPPVADDRMQRDLMGVAS